MRNIINFLQKETKMTNYGRITVGIATGILLVGNVWLNKRASELEEKNKYLLDTNEVLKDFKREHEEKNKRIFGSGDIVL